MWMWMDGEVDLTAIWAIIRDWIMGFDGTAFAVGIIFGAVCNIFGAVLYQFIVRWRK